ncbi:hypothetical protein P154DRAFT_476181 [Amniculicola lignicola CBS 123094]|uniref:Altered inheritance of mitochondria protein 6 n=1 Tax=Amniculicola lignicola CBS 123094 TaxID=1392246 RepID=A0A6A5VZL5_9PLEO|nr:hypothetical protein P154DRAFT_476181 [Amniculicola lignicola CBS 123094]
MAHPPASTQSAAKSAMLRDFDEAAKLELKNAPIVSLRSLEDGDSECDDAHQGPGSRWLRLLIPRRKNTRASLPQHHAQDFRRGLRGLKWKRHGLFACLGSVVLVLIFFGVVHIANVAMSLVPMLWDEPDVSFSASWNPMGDASPELSYITDLTKDVQPVPCHSHNDYWRRIPLYEALHYGCVGVEADVWLFDNDLFVGHNTQSLTRTRTFQSMYVEPLTRMLDNKNIITEFIASDLTLPKNGVYETDPDQTLVLLVDFKNSGDDIYPFVVEQLTPLREKGYLSYFDGTSVVRGPITVVATGNAPFDTVTANTTHRDIFFDAPLDRMFEDPNSEAVTNQSPSLSPRLRKRGQGQVGTDEDSVFDSTNSYYASVSFSRSIGHIWGGQLNPEQINLIRGQIKGAQRRGLKARYWSTPQWPIGLRNHIWDVLIQEGADILNGDDLQGMVRLDWTKKRHHGWL